MQKNFINRCVTNLCLIAALSALAVATYAKPLYKDLIPALQSLDVATIKRLVNAGVTINPVLHDPPICIILSSTNNSDPRQFEIIKFLLEKGADPSKSDKDHKTPLLYVFENGASFDRKMANLIYKYGRGKINTSESLYDILCHEPIVCEEPMEPAKWLIAHDANVNYRERLQMTPLMQAAGREANVVSLLIDNGADVNAVDKERHTSLMYAAASLQGDMDLLSNPNCAHVLLEHGAKVDAQDDDGNTAMMWLGRAATEEDAIIMAKDLVAHGASINLRNKKGRTAYYIAKARKHFIYAKYLKSIGGHD